MYTSDVCAIEADTETRNTVMITKMVQCCAKKKKKGFWLATYLIRLLGFEISSSWKMPILSREVWQTTVHFSSSPHVLDDNDMSLCAICPPGYCTWSHNSDQSEDIGHRLLKKVLLSRKINYT